MFVRVDLIVLNGYDVVSPIIRILLDLIPIWVVYISWVFNSLFLPSPRLNLSLSTSLDKDIKSWTWIDVEVCVVVLSKFVLLWT